jgi:uncharacterized GH25 family protein
MTSLVRVAAAVVLLFSTTGIASAHHLWLEVDGQGTRVYFGEFGENLREVSPGSLDRLQPQAKVVSSSGERPLAVEKKANAFAASGKIDAADSVVVEDARYPVFVRTQGGTTTRSIYWPAARFVPDRAPRQPVLALDVVPAGGDKFVVSFKGKPLAKAKVTVITPSGWGREIYTSEDGGFDVALPWRGPYVFEVQHADKTPGKRGDDAYDQVNYVTSLTVVQPQGIEPLPAPPPAKPH